MRIALLAVGDELLLGDIVNANAAWLGSRLAAAGHIVTAALVVGDTVGEIEEAVSASYREVGALVVTGGLGPTQDDLTREGLAAAAGVPLVRDEGLVEVLYARYATLGRSFPARNLHQCDLPRGASAIPNPLGSAPGIRLELPGRVVYALPGVPHEMEAMVEASVLPDLAARDPGRGLVVTRTVRTAGMWESAVAEELADLDSRLRAGGSAQLAYLAGRGEVRVRITAYAPDAASAAALVEPAEAEIRARLGAAVYGVDEDSLATAVQCLLLARGATVAVAESLTGGLLGAAITEVAGSSAVFRGGVIAYATEVKHSTLGVPADLLARDGAVSPAAAAAMAVGVREQLQATYGLAVTGVAGPDPQEDHPPGTVHLALDGPTGGEARSLRLPGDRSRVRSYSVVAALDLLRRHLERESGP